MGQIGNVNPGVFLHWRFVDKDWDAVVTIVNDFFVDVEPSGVPVSDRLVRGDMWKKSL
jgi:hypothetical protein